MPGYQNILYVTNGHSDQGEALKQAVTLAAQCQSKLTVMLTYPELPAQLQHYRATFEGGLQNEITKNMQTIREEGSLSIDLSAVEFISSTKKPVFIEIIHHVLQHNNDLVIKEAWPFNADTMKGLRALDINLIRKCPCPVWLGRPYVADGRFNLALAIDAYTDDQIEEDINTDLIHTAAELTRHLDGHLTILSCWDFTYEPYLRKSGFVRIPDQDLDDMVEQEQQNHEKALNNWIKSANFKGLDYTVLNPRGLPEDIIPKFIEDKNIDLLIMGTVGRAGIPGFVMGNTAEDILQQINSSLLAIKPKGFKTPVDA